MKIVLGLIVLSIILNVIGQILFKAGMNQIGHFDFSLQNSLPIAWKFITNACLMAGLVVYLVSTIVWFLVLSRTDVSFAYPLLSIGYIVNSIAAYYVLHEQAFSPLRLIGTLIITFGVILICQS